MLVCEGLGSELPRIQQGQAEVPGHRCVLRTCDLNVSFFVQQDAERQGRKQMLYKKPGGGLTWGHSGPGWGAVPTQSRRPRADVGFGIYSSFCWVTSGFRSIVFGINEAKAGTCRFETSFSPQEGSGTLQTVLREERD